LHVALQGIVKRGKEGEHLAVTRDKGGGSVEGDLCKEACEDFALLWSEDINIAFEGFVCGKSTEELLRVVDVFVDLIEVAQEEDAPMIKCFEGGGFASEPLVVTMELGEEEEGIDASPSSDTFYFTPDVAPSWEDEGTGRAEVCGG